MKKSTLLTAGIALIIIFILLAIAPLLFAGTTSIGKNLKVGLPSVVHATVFNVTEKDVWDGVIVPVIEYKGLLSLPIGIMTDGNKGIPVIGLGFVPTEIKGISSKLGDIAIGYLFGYDMNEKKSSWGIYIGIKVYEDK